LGSVEIDDILGLIVTQEFYCQYINDFRFSTAAATLRVNVTAMYCIGLAHHISHWQTRRGTDD